MSEHQQISKNDNAKSSKHSQKTSPQFEQIAQDNDIGAILQGGELDLMSEGSIKQLQKTIGNQATLQLLRDGGQINPMRLPHGFRPNDKKIQRALTYNGFKSAADTINTSLKVSKTSLGPILTLLQNNEGNWVFDTLTQLETAISTLETGTPRKFRRYASALATLGQNIVTERQATAGRIGIDLGDNLYAVQANGLWNVYNRTTDATVVQGLSATEKNYLVGVMNYMAQKEGTTGITVKGRAGLVKEMVKDRDKMQSGDFRQGPWQDALNMLEQTVITRVADDIDLLVADNLITDQHRLSSVKFTGSDFHKGGQQVIFLYFTLANGSDERKVVYKPSSLWLDALLFGEDSVAAMLDPTGDVISQYGIISVADENDEDEGYGYMEFVESGLPSSAMDLLGVYRSIAGSMAMAYLVGMDDIHKENVLLLKNKIQVIDMEATTGVFDKRATVGFIGQQWNASINMIKDKLLPEAQSGNLRTAPATAIVENAMKEEFGNILDRAESGSIDTKWDENKNEMADTTSRIVPIATADFYDFVTLVRDRQLNTYAKWSNHVNNNIGDILEKAQGLTTNSLDSMKRILLSQGTYKALAKGDIPYYTRDLGSSNIFDEDGNAIDAAGHKKVGGSIADEMDDRRGEDKGAVKALFESQGVRLVKDVNDDVLARIAYFKSTQ